MSHWRVLCGDMRGKRDGLCLVHVNLHWSNTTDLAQRSGIRLKVMDWMALVIWFLVSGID